MLLDFFTPIGRTPDRVSNPRRRNAAPARTRLYNPSPLTIALGIGVGAAVVGAGVAYFRHRDQVTGGGKAPLLDPDNPNNVLANFVKMGATLGESQYVVDDIAQPIYLGLAGAPIIPSESATDNYARVSELAIYVNTGPMEVVQAIFGMDPSALNTPKENAWTAWDEAGKRMYGQKTPKAIALLVTNVTGDFARFAYEYVLALIAQDESSWETDEARDATIQHILTELAPQLDWSKGLSPYVYGDAAYIAWTAVELLGEVAYQSLVNKS